MSRAVELAPGAIAHLAAAALIFLVLVACGQPLFTDDTWWHLALGRAFAHAGPWLAGDPLLYTAPGPPRTHAWLADVLLYGAERVGGFSGLRALHVLGVCAIVALAWASLRRVAGSAGVASLLATAFVCLATYRVVQLRPELFTIFAALVVYRVAIRDETPLSARRIAAIAMLFGLWANLHAGFLLGPVLLASALGGLLLAAPLRDAEQRLADRARARSLALALAFGSLATFANPGGVEPHLAYFAAGESTPSLARVGDEWARVHLFAPPPHRLPPSPLVWTLLWGLVVATGVCAVVSARRWRLRVAAPDPALVGVAVAGLAGTLTAVRFSWLSIFPLLLLAWTLRPVAPSRVTRWACAALLVTAVPTFLRYGDWPMVSRAIARETYAQPYPAAKYYAHAVWFLADAGVEGRMYNHYFLGGFAGYWLAPSLRAFSNGSLNVRAEMLDANRSILERRGERPDEDFPELLDRLRIDVFFGIRLPSGATSARPHFVTTAHLEGVPGWIPVFRNLRSAVYLRANAANRDNLSRVAAYYAEREVPFDPQAGFDVEAVIRNAPGWAIDNGVVPRQFRQLVEASLRSDPTMRRIGLDIVAKTYASLGLYELALRSARRLSGMDTTALAPRMVEVWSLLRLGRLDEAREAASQLDAAPADYGLPRRIAAVARDAATLDPAETARAIATLPLLTPIEAASLTALQVPPWPRARE